MFKETMLQTEAERAPFKMTYTKPNTQNSRKHAVEQDVNDIQNYSAAKSGQT